MVEKDDDVEGIDNDFISKFIRDDNEVKVGKSSLSMFGDCDKGSKEVFSSKEEDIFSEDLERFRKNPVGGFGGGDDVDEVKMSSDVKGPNRIRGPNDITEPSEDELMEITKIESKSVIADAKKEFLDSIKNDSLTVDTCSQVNRDWGKK